MSGVNLKELLFLESKENTFSKDLSGSENAFRPIKKERTEL